MEQRLKIGNGKAQIPEKAKESLIDMLYQMHVSVPETQFSSDEVSGLIQQNDPFDHGEKATWLPRKRGVS